MKMSKAKLGILIAVLACAMLPLAAAAAQKANKPLSQQEVMELVENYVPSGQIIQLVHQFGIGFKPTNAFVGKLRAAGADEDLISALRAATPAEPPKPVAPARKKEPLSDQQVSTLLSSGIPSDAVAELVEKLGITFAPTDDALAALRQAGAEQSLLNALRKAKRFSPPAPTSPPTAAPEKHEGKAAEVASKSKTTPVAQKPVQKTADVQRAPAAKLEAKTQEQPPPAQAAAAEPPKPETPQGPLNVGGDVSPPAPLYTPAAPYTEEARRAHLQGSVVLSIVINEQGKITKVQQISKPLGLGLDKNARETVRTWMFRPAEFRGMPVPVRINVRVNFQQRF